VSKAPTLRFGRRAAGLIGAGLLVFVSGCNLLPFVSNDERIQIGYIRSFKKGLSPTDNKAFGVMLREVGKLLGYNLPTRYGLSVTPYLAPFPGVEPLTPTITAQPVPDPSSRELLRIADQGNQLSIAYNSSFDSAKQAYTYTATIERTPTGMTGKYAVQTSGSNWRRQQDSANYVLGQYMVPSVVNSMALQAQLSLPQSAGLATMQVSLGFDQGSGTTPVPGNASITFQLQNNLAANLSGRYGSLDAAILNGTVTVKGDKSNDTYQADVKANGGNADVVLISDQRKLRIDLKFENGLLSGVAKATDGRQAELAKFVQEAGKAPEIQYADGTKETWNFVIPN